MVLAAINWRRPFFVVKPVSHVVNISILFFPIVAAKTFTAKNALNLLFFCLFF